MDAVGWATIIGTAVAGASLYYTVRRIAGGALNSRNTSAASGSFAMGYKSQINVGTADQPGAVKPADGSGGKGGGGTIVRGRGEIIGGPGGDGGDPNSGRGGDGGSGTAIDAVYARIVGGAGGNAGQTDGRGGRAAASGIEIAGGPTSLWIYGRGGLGANAPEYNRRLGILTAIREEYLAVFQDEAPFVNAGIDQVPVNWVNSRLEELGETWRVEMREGGYKMPPLAAP